MSPTTLNPITAQSENEHLTQLGISDVRVNEQNRRATITSLWRYDVENKSKSINFNVYTKDAAITIYDDEGKELGTYSTKDHDGWTVEDKSLDYNDTIMPSYAEVDLEDKSIIINW